MNKLYIFGIGGTGSRVLKSLTMLLAAGVKCDYDIVPIIVDPDAANANLTDTVATLRRYQQIRKLISFNENTKNEFFRTDIQDTLNGFRMPLEQTNQKFSSFINLAGLSPANQALSQMLFSERNLSADMQVGFKGNPNIGCVVMNQIATQPKFKDFANSFQSGDKIFIVSSIFGGTGASGFPLLLKTFRTNQALPNFKLINGSEIGAISVLPYFSVKQSNSSSIDSSTFISKTKSALAYYEKNLSDIDYLYYIGDDSYPVYNNNEGGTSQNNDANFIELLAASAIIDFSKTAKQKATVYKELGMKDIEQGQSVSFETFCSGLDSMLHKPMTRLVLFANYIKTHFDKFQTLSLSIKAQFDQNFLTGPFVGDLKSFLSDYLNWLEQMEKNKRPLKLFNLQCGNKPFNVVEGVKPASVFSTKSDYDLFDSRLNSVSSSSSKEPLLMEAFFVAIDGLINDKKL